LILVKKYVKLVKKLGEFMETLLLIVSILLIAIVLLQSNKASDASQIITGGNAELFQNQKERGSELLITRITLILGLAFFVLSFILYIS
jgi:preprotein translocase subunit SecG